MLTLRQLRYLDALARCGHFGKAAQSCSVSQPALSMQIRELEEFLGAELVERRQGAVTPTEIGAEVASRARSILSATRDLVDFARHSGSVLGGTLRLGVIPTLAPYLLPRLLPQLRHGYPELRVELRETQTKPLLAELGNGALDAVMLALPLDEPEFETVPLFEDRFLLAVPADDLLPETCRATPRDVAARTLLLLEEGHCLRDQALSFCAAPRSEAAAGLGATSLATLIQMVASGHGVTLIPEIATDVEIRDQRLKLLRFAEPQPSRTIGIAWRRTSARKAGFTALGRTAIEALDPAAARPRIKGTPMRGKERIIPASKRDTSAGRKVLRRGNPAGVV
jgi:LysR family hydrogen peroxide-inducible transcriptional activator